MSNTRKVAHDGREFDVADGDAAVRVMGSADMTVWCDADEGRASMRVALDHGEVGVTLTPDDVQWLGDAIDAAEAGAFRARGVRGEK